MSEEFELAESLLNDAAVLLDPRPSDTIVVPGNQVAWDICENGLLWVRVAGIVGHDLADCCVDYVVITYGLGILRCVPISDEDGRPPPPAALTEAAYQVLQDQMMLRTAITAKLCSKTSPRLSSLRWIPLGPEGGAAGGEWSFEVKVLL